MIQPGEFCRVTNNSDGITKIKFNGQVFNLPSHKEVVVPVAAAFTWFGDPRTSGKVQLLRNEQGKVNNLLPSRGDEVKRLRFKYGGDMGGDETTLDGVNLPDVTVTDLDGNEVVMVINDVEGKHIQSASPEQSAANQADELLTIVKKQERQISLLMRQLQMDDGDDSAPLNATQDELPTDDISESRPHFKVYNTETGMPGPSMGELVK